MDKTFERKSKHLFFLCFFCFIFIFGRILLLCTVKNDALESEARKYQQKTLLIPAERGTLRDAHNRPLAINKLDLQAKIIFEPIKQLPRYKFQKIGGKRAKIFFRKNYIDNLCSFLSSALSIDKQEIKDLIYSKAVIFPNTPFLLKEKINEKTYYYLKARSKDWPGLELHLASKRNYPQKTTASHIVGYMGQVSLDDFLAIKDEIGELKAYLKQKSLSLPIPLLKGYKSSQEVHERLEFLQKKGYLINEKVGRGGLERVYEKDLKGFLGKKKFAIDCKSNQLRQLPHNEPKSPGRRVFSTIDIELQGYAEKLLKEFHFMNNQAYKDPHHRFNTIAPWQRKFALIAMEPKSGKIVAMASTPNFDPNDFEENNVQAIQKALEAKPYIQNLYNGKTPLDKEMYLPTPSKYLCFELFLDRVLAKDSHVKKRLQQMCLVNASLKLQEAFDTCIHQSQSSAKDCINSLFNRAPHIKTFHALEDEQCHKLQEKLKECTQEKELLFKNLTTITNNNDKLLLLDILRLGAKPSLFSQKLREKTKSLTLSAYFQVHQEAHRAEALLKNKLQSPFEKMHFSAWKSMYFEDYLKEKRKIERTKKRAVRPYTDYLHEVRNDLFTEFFEQHKKELMLCFFTSKHPENIPDELLPYFRVAKDLAPNHQEIHLSYLRNLLLTFEKQECLELFDTLRDFKHLSARLYGRYYSLRSGKNATLADLALAFYPKDGFGYTKSMAYQDNVLLGSIFKIVTGYEALRQNILKQEASQNYHSLNPFTLTDLSPSYTKSLNANTVLAMKDGKKITRRYKGGRMPRGTPNIGTVTFQEAFERSSNCYFSLLASDYLRTANDLSNCAKIFGFGQKSGIDLLGEAKGSVPHDLSYNISNLFSFAIGHHTLTVTPLQVAYFLSSLANKGSLLEPKIVNLMANLEPKKSHDFEFHPDYPYKRTLDKIGIYFPLFSQANEKKLIPFVEKREQKIKNEIYCPDELRDYLFDSLHLVTNSNRGSARASAIGSLWRSPLDLKIYRSVQRDMIGKTGTAEFCYKPWLDRAHGAVLAKQTWFCAMSFENYNEHHFEKPELVVVVASSFSDYGKELAPIAAKVIHKYRSLK